jgi:cytochrome P450
MTKIADIYSTEIDKNPFPTYTILREEYPCYWMESANAWILTRYEDVNAANQDWQTYSSTGGNFVDEIPGRAGATLGTTDPPRHDRLRNLAQAAFLRRNSEHLRATVENIASKSLDRISEMETFDYIDDYTSRITVGTLFELLGLPESDHREIRRKAVLAVSTDKKLRGRNAEQVQAFRDLAEFIGREVKRRRAEPRADLITHLAEAEIDGDRLSNDEVVLMTATFVMAGVESLSSFMTVLALNLHDFPEVRKSVVTNPSRIPDAIEESLRYNTTAQRFARRVTTDCELHGQTMRAGDKVILAYGAANRDWRKFPNPDIYDLDRRPSGHMGFGGGKHFCLGSQLARFVTEISTAIFLSRIPDYERSTNKIDWTPSSNFRSPAALPLRALY